MLKILHCLKQQLKQSYDSGKENSNKEIMRSLIAVEVLLRTNLLNANAYEDALRDELNMMMSVEKKVSSEIAIKSKKILSCIQKMKILSQNVMLKPHLLDGSLNTLVLPLR